MVEPCKLIPNNALEGRTQKASHSVALTYASDEEIDIVNVLVDHLQTLYNLVWDVVNHVVKMGHPAQPTQFPEAVVAWKSMVPPTLDVQGCQVHSKALVSLEEMVGQLVRHDVVEVLAWLTGKPDEESVKASRSVDELGVEELVGEWDRAYSPSLDGSFLDQAAKYRMSGWMLTTWYLLQQTLDQCVTKSEGSSGETVEDCRIDLSTVLLAVPTTQG